MSDGSLIFDDLSDGCAPGIRLWDIGTQIAEDQIAFSQGGIVLLSGELP